MKLALVSVRGIPNHYGGLEEFAENVSVRLVQRGHEVIVYSPSFHPYTGSEFKGVKIVRKWSPEKQIGAAANFIYDYLSLRDSLIKDCDAVLVCGYAAAAIWYYVLPIKKTLLITNIDGLEWKRAKWSRTVQKLFLWFESIALRKSDVIIADNPGIADYLLENFQLPSVGIAYGADIVINPDESILSKFGLKKYDYNVIIGRLEPENNIEVILDGVAKSESKQAMHIFANDNTRYGRYLKDKYKEMGDKIIFHGWTSGQHVLGNLRYFANLYFHGHSVGGTNPSLLEAMAGRAFIVAHNNPFNKYVLGEDALYFYTADDIKRCIDQCHWRLRSHAS